MADENELTYDSFFSIHQKMFEEITALFIKKQNSYTQETYNSTQKIICKVLNEPFAKDIFGTNRFSLVQYNGVIGIKDSKAINNISFSQFDMNHHPDINIKNKLYFSQVIEAIDERIIDKNERPMFRYKSFNNAGSIELELNNLEQESYNKYIQESKIGRYLSQKESVDDFLQRKMNKPENNLTVDKTESFTDHYYNVTSSPYLNYFGEDESRKSIIKYLNSIISDFDFREVIPLGIEETVGDLIFYSIKNNGEVIGGTTLYEGHNHYKIRNVDIVEKFNNLENIEKSVSKILETLPKNANVVVDVNVDNNELVIQAFENLKNNSHLKIYSTKQENESFYQLNTFFEEKKIPYNQRAKIIDLHYDSVIKKLTDNEEENIKLNKSFLNQHKTDNKIDIKKLNRKDFIDQMMFSTASEDEISQYIKYSSNMKRKEFFISDVLNKEDIHVEEAFNFINKLFVKNNIFLDMFQMEALKDDIDKNLSIDYVYDGLSYNYNQAYDFLCEQGVMSTKEKKTIYRLEASDNSRLYQAKVLDEDSPKNYLLNLYDRSNPVNENNINYVFNKDFTKEGHAMEWFFGFNSKQQLQKWFDKDNLNLLEKHNVKISTYEVNNNFYLEGKKQVIFKMEKSKKIKEENISDFLNSPEQEQKKKKIRELKI